MGSFPSRGDLPQQSQPEESAEIPVEAPPAPTELKGLKAFARPAEEISPAEPGPTAQVSADFGSELSEPDWLSAKKLSEEPTVQGIATNDLDWLSAAMPTESSVSEEVPSPPIEAAPVMSAASDDLDWLDSTTVLETAPEQAESGSLASDEADMDWLDSALAETSEAQESAPIKSIKRLPKTDDVPATEQTDQPRTIKKLPKTEEQPAVRTIKKLPTATPEASSYEDWERTQLAAEQSAESSVDDVPDWFQTAGSPAPAADDVPDWFKNVQQPAPAQPQPQPQDDVPDWFRGMDVSSTPLAGPVQTPGPSAAPTPASSAPTEDVPDWFKGAGADNLDFNAMFGVTGSAPATPEPSVPVPAAASEITALPSESDALDWMADLPDTLSATDANEPATSGISTVGADEEASDMPEWMRDLGPTEPTPPVQAKPAEITQEPELDWLADIDESAFKPAAQIASATTTPEVSFTGFGDLADDTIPEAPVNLDLSAPVDIDALLKMAEEREGADPAVYKPIPGSGPLPGTDLFTPDEVDLDVLLGPLPGESEAPEKPLEALAEGAEGAPAVTQESQGEVPEWLAEIRPSEGPAVLRIGDQEVRIVEKSRSPLSDEMRLIRERSRAIRKRAAEKPAEKPGESASPVAGPLAGIGGALDPFTEVVTPGSTLTQPMITDAYVRRVRLIQKILETEEQMLRDRALAEDVREAKQAAQVAKPTPQARTLPKFDRLIITLLLVVAIVAPFFIKGLNIVPPLNVAQLTVPQGKVAATIDALQPDQPVLVAFEYGPTAAGELDDMARVILRDLIRRKARPVIVSTNSAGAMHAQSLIASMADSTDEQTMMARLGQPLVARQDYVVLRYLPGGASGVRAMATALVTGGLQEQIVFATDIEGKPSGLVEQNIISLRSSPAFVLTEAPEDVRNWVEQYRSIPPQNPFPIVLLSSASASATAQAYARSDTSNRIPGVLVGLRDALTYQTIRQPMPAGAVGDRSRELVAQRWQSVGVSAMLASAVIALGAVLNLIRALTRREPR
jgi:hypothetical protein